MLHARNRRNHLLTKTFLLVLTSFIGGNIGGSVQVSWAQHPSLERQQKFGSSTSGDSEDSNSGTGGADNDSSSSSSSGGEILAPKSFMSSPQEPTCEELRAMWIFSKRQSRAAEITNEIPSYRDPFAYNVWDPLYSSPRNMAGSRMRSHFGDRRRPVFGRIVSREPLIASHIQVRPRFNDDMTRIYGAENRAAFSSASGQMPRRQVQFRFGGGGYSGVGPLVGSPGANALAVHQGSFQKLKELIWTERSKELTQQRRAEEMAARAAVLKEIANGQNFHSGRKQHVKMESPIMDVNRSPEQDNSDNNDRMPIEVAQSSLVELSDGGSDSAFNRRGPHTSHSQTTKPKSFFSGNPASMSGRTSARLLLPSMNRPRSLASVAEDDEQEHENAPARAFPLRPSLFRERNRALLRQAPSPGAFFQRNLRNRNHGNIMQMLRMNLNLEDGGDLIFEDNNPRLQLQHIPEEELEDSQEQLEDNEDLAYSDGIIDSLRSIGDTQDKVRARQSRIYQNKKCDNTGQNCTPSLTRSSIDDILSGNSADMEYPLNDLYN